MWQDIRNQPSALAIAISLHVMGVALLLVAFDFKTPTVGRPTPAQPQIVEAVAISGAEYDAALERIETAKRREAAAVEERRRQEAEAQQRRAAEAKRAAEEQARQEQARREAQAKREAEAKRAAEAQRAAEEKARQEKARAEAEAKRQAELKRQQELEAQRRAEAERKAEQERMAAALAAEEAALQEAARRRQEAEAQARLNAQLASLRDEYLAAIVARIQGNWERPIGAQNNQRARLLVRQARGGFITDVKMLRCEGNDAFCRSVLDAVWRSDPLPAPPREELFDAELEIEFDPDQR